MTLRTGRIFLVGDSGQAQLVSTAALRALFQALKGNVRVVLLSSCYSEAQAKAITDCIDVCIGMSSSVDDRTAIAFAASFYRGLAFGESIDNAFDQGRVAIMLAGLPEPDAPKLATKSGVIPSSIVLVQAPVASKSHTSSIPHSVPAASLAQEIPRAPERPRHNDSGSEAGEAPGSTAVDDENWRYEVVPSAALRLYRLSWQLEVWLRTLVYVELRAARLEWGELLKPHVQEWPPQPQAGEAGVSHVAASDLWALSSLSFHDLARVILGPSNWPLFSPYFPPRRNTEVKMEEIGTVRDRVVQFREPQAQDESRLKLFLQEWDPGLQRFCSRYTTGKVPRGPIDDPVTEYLSAKWSRVGYGIELNRPDLDWLYAPPPYRGRPMFHASLRLLTHERYTAGSAVGVIYRLICHPMSAGRMNLADFLDSTRALHKHIIHIVVSPVDDEVAVTVPAVHGVEGTGDILGAFLNAARDCSRSHVVSKLTSKLDWPQYVVWPSDFLAPFVGGYSGPVFDYE
ncbi:hypothetical protein [Sorangium sp. So ce204]|uniref:hypothetical protein n=1 Tax=Sorangium sp. So ce204 TaxID=3133288 RepID=UPI003F60A101